VIHQELSPPQLSIKPAAKNDQTLSLATGDQQQAVVVGGVEMGGATAAVAVLRDDRPPLLSRTSKVWNEPTYTVGQVRRRLASLENQVPHLRTPNPGFNPEFCNILPKILAIKKKSATLNKCFKRLLIL
jgi:hypothetical protein